jgi:hypothetical protein
VPTNNSLGKPGLDARTFQRQLGELTNTIALKVNREAQQLGFKPLYSIPDIYFLIRHAQQTYNAFFYVNADERRQSDFAWRPAYLAVMLPLVRTMIDCLYNITAILLSPGVNGYWFRSSGYKSLLESLDRDEARYGGNPGWDDWIDRQRKSVSFNMRNHGFLEQEVRANKTYWPTLNQYLKIAPNATPTAHQDFLARFTLGFWREYSGISHAAFQGVLSIGTFLAPDDLPHEDRPKVDEIFQVALSIHLPRVSAILLIILTEVQTHFKFDGARINQRLHEVWVALSVAPEIKDLFDQRYADLMKEKGINPT